MININSQTSIQELKQAFSQEKEQVINILYKSFRSDFLAFINKYSRDQEMNVDCYQDTIMAFYENLVNNKVQDSDSTAKTYLFAIGKNQILNALKKQKKLNENSDFEMEKMTVMEDNYDEQKELLSMGFDQLGEKCKDVLLNFYYNQYSIEAIMHEMSYKNENTVKAHKSRCLSQLRSILLNLKNN